MSGKPRTDFQPDRSASRIVMARLDPEHQNDLRTILRIGKARSMSDAIQRGLRREALAVRRMRRRGRAA